MSELILGYLLVGFVLHWIGAQVFKIPPNKSTTWELAAAILWPLTLLALLCIKIRSIDRFLRQRVKDAQHL